MAQLDPSRTVMLRRQFIREMRRRFMSVSRAVRELVVDLDVFGLNASHLGMFSVNVERQAWRFQTSEQKLRSFNRWLQGQVDEKILTVEGTGVPWTNKFVNSSYRKGTVRAFIDARKAEAAAGGARFEGSKEEFLRTAFTQPERISKLQILYTRTFAELGGVSATAKQKLNRILANGLANGLNPRAIARQMTAEISKLTRTRALMIARTEVISAHAEGQLDSFEQLGVEEVGIMAEWSTAGDDRVCPQCAPLEGVVMKVKEARGLIPRHPNCRCAWIPAPSEPQKNRKRRMRRSIRASLQGEQGGITRAHQRFAGAQGLKVPKLKKARRSVKAAKRRSTWLGKERG